MKTRKRSAKIVAPTEIEIKVEDGKRRTQTGKRYCKWSEEKMIEALDAMRTKGVGLNKAAKMFSVPKATLKRHLEGTNRFASEGKKVMGSQKSIPHEVENEIKQRVQQLEDTPFGMTGVELRKLAYEIAESKGIAHKFSKTKKMAGRHWYYSFIRRHPDINLRRPNATMYTLAAAFERQEMKLQDGQEPEEIEKTEKHDSSVESRNESDSESEEEQQNSENRNEQILGF